MGKEGKLAGRKALVTGSGTGIGLEIALEFSRQGADVVLHYHSAHSESETGAISAVEEIQARGGRAAAFQADFRNTDEALELADKATEFLGGITCLVNNAGITMNMPFLKTTHQQFDALFNVNFRSPYFLTQRVAQKMGTNSEGAVLNITSVHGFQGVPEHSVYAATKGAIIACTRTLGVELAWRGIRFNAIAPGWVIVESQLKAMPGVKEADLQETAKKAIPVARAGRPLDIAKLAVFLCSDDAEFIVGQTIVVDGGTTSLMSLFPDFRSEMKAKFGIEYI